MGRRAALIWLWALLLLAPVLEGRAADLYRVTANNVNVRSGPGYNYKVIDHRNAGDIVTVLSIYQNDWARIRYGASAFAYIHMGYLSYKGPVPEEPRVEEPKAGKTSWRETFSVGGEGLWTLDGIFRIVRIIALISLGLWLLLSAFDSDLGVKFFYPFAGYILGYIVGWVLGYAHTWAIIGEGGGVLTLLFLLFEDGIHIGDMSGFLKGASFIGWQVISWPFKVLNRLQFFLSKPWRSVMKRHWAEESRKPALRTTLWVLQFPFYLLLFPLRLVTAAYYNLVAHLLYELTDYLLEVFSPTDYQMGRGNAGRWILWFPLRVGLYLVYHFGLTVIESVVWTVIDTFIPALTLYHGTNGMSAEEMVREPGRTRESRRYAVRQTGTWTVGAGNYAGDGIYFGISGKTLNNYQRGAFVVARVSLGKTIDIPLMPASVYRTAGHENAHDVSKWGITHGYTTGEWWRDYPGWWEFCLFDRQNRYNYSWRIRPVYVLNYDNGIMQRTHRGMAHWLFRKMVLQDIRYSLTHLFG